MSRQSWEGTERCLICIGAQTLYLFFTNRISLALSEGEKMQGVARNFFTLAIIYALCGMAVGLYMAISHDHSQMTTHAHIMVAGWLMSSVFAFFYHLVPAAAGGMLARVHFWLTAVSGILLVVGLFFLMAGNTAMEAVTALGSICFYAAMLLFAFIAIPAIYRTA